MYDQSYWKSEIFIDLIELLTGANTKLRSLILKLGISLLLLL